VSKEKEGGIIAEQIFKRIAVLNSDHGPVLGRLVRCLGFLVFYILWIELAEISMFRVNEQLFSTCRQL
jgi:hypothetical protein